MWIRQLSPLMYKKLTAVFFNPLTNEELCLTAFIRVILNQNPIKVKPHLERNIKIRHIKNGTAKQVLKTGLNETVIDIIYTIKYLEHKGVFQL